MGATEVRETIPATPPAASSCSRLRGADIVRALATRRLAPLGASAGGSRGGSASGERLGESGSAWRFRNEHSNIARLCNDTSTALQ
eukprot:1858014-Pleurochrysis_carterae.AAC.1